MDDRRNLLVLVQGIRQGSESAFRQLYDQTQSRVFTLALGYVRNREDAEEITQDVFIEVFQSANAFKGEAAVTTWIYRIAVNKSLDFLKKQRRKKRFALFTNLFRYPFG